MCGRTPSPASPRRCYVGPQQLPERVCKEALEWEIQTRPFNACHVHRPPRGRYVKATGGSPKPGTFVSPVMPCLTMRPPARLLSSLTGTLARASRPDSAGITESLVLPAPKERPEKQGRDRYRVLFRFLVHRHGAPLSLFLLHLEAREQGSERSGDARKATQLVGRRAALKPDLPGSRPPPARILRPHWLSLGLESWNEL